MKTTTVAAGAALLFNIARGAAVGYTFYLLYEIGPAPIPSEYAPSLTLTSVISLALFPIPFLFFFWIGWNAKGLARNIGSLVLVLLVGSFVGYLAGFAAVILAESVQVSLFTSFDIFGAIQFTFLAFSAMAMAFLWRSRGVSSAVGQPAAEAVLNATADPSLGNMMTNGHIKAFYVNDWAKLLTPYPGVTFSPDYKQAYYNGQPITDGTRIAG